MAVPSILLPAILASLFLSHTLSETTVSHQTPSSCPDQSSQNSLSSEVEEAKLKIARLESILDNRLAEIDAKSKCFRDTEKRIEELTAEIDRLKTAVSSFEHGANLKLAALEEEIRLLWSASRKNNFEIHALEQKAMDAESRLKEVATQVEETADIVSEQWIQIQQLEQAVHMAKMRTSKVKWELWRRCPFVKFFMDLVDNDLKTLKEILDPYFARVGSLFVFCKSRSLQAFGAAKHYHHQLQSFIRHAMHSNKLTNKLTAAFAHEEVVFFVASALVAFPLTSSCMLLISQFS